MSDYRIRLTVDETRHLFHTMMQTMRKECEEEYGDIVDASHSADASAAKNAQFESIWHNVEEELRKAYESCRFAMNVEDLDDSTNLDVFRGNCEDIDGIDPIDDMSFTKISHEIVDINKALETRAAYRSQVPTNIEAMFVNHVKNKREHFDSILSIPSGEGGSVESPELRVTKFPPQDLGLITGESAKRLTDSKEQAELIVKRDSE